MPIQAPAPPDDQPNSAIPPGVIPHTIEVFNGLNTSALRAGIRDDQCSWIDGFIPLDRRNLRTLYGPGAAMYAPGGGITIVCFYPVVLQGTPYHIVFLSNGGVVQVNLLTNAAATILTASTLLAPSVTSVGVAQWGSDYILIVADQPNGYWAYDGTTVFKAGTLAPLATLTDPGSAYQSAPVVTVTGGSGSGAQVVATVAGGYVTDLTVTNPGSGYLATDTVQLAFSGGNSGGAGASLTANMTNQAGGSGASLTAVLSLVGSPAYYAVTSVTINSGGAGYSSYASATVSGGAVFGGNNAVLALTVLGGVITAVSIVNGGAYTAASPVPSIAITDAGTFVVSSVTVSAGGSGYSASTSVVASGGSSPSVQATLRPVISGGVITSVTVLQGGRYGGAAPAPALTVSDAPRTAAGTVTLMPFGVKGTCIETYSQRAWVGDGTLLHWTAPGTFYNFATSAGGGSEKSGDSNLRTQYVRLVNTNGFLFLVGDSSLSYISGVTTSGTPPTTTFTKQNADPQVGTPYPASVQVLGRDIMLANAVGIYRCSGGLAQKISQPLDGIYNSSPDFGGLQLSCAQATIFGRKITMYLVQIVNPITNSVDNRLMMFDEKSRWFTALQRVPLIQVACSEYNSILTAYGTDGSAIYALFQTPTASITKYYQGPLWDNPGIFAVKASGRLFAMAQYYDTTGGNISVVIDNENGIGTVGYTISAPPSPRLLVAPPQAVGQTGVLTGLTIQTTCADMALMEIGLFNENVGYRG